MRLRSVPSLVRRTAFLLLSLVSVSVLSAQSTTAPSSSPAASADAARQAKIQKQLTQLHQREKADATPHELALRWALLGSEYGNGGSFPEAEGAYNRALELLAHQQTEAVLYADILDQLGSLYRIYGRIDDAIHAYRASLAVREPLGDPLENARSRAHLAEAALFAHRYKEAYAETESAFRSMSNMHDPDDTDRISALIVKAYAACGMHQCKQGLDDAQQALAIANREFPGDTMQVGASLVVLGYLQHKTGDNTQADQSLNRAIAIMHTRISGTDPRLVFALEQQRDALLALHRKPEADDIRQQLALMAQHPTCSQCTVSALVLREPTTSFQRAGTEQTPRPTGESALSTLPAPSPQVP